MKTTENTIFLISTTLIISMLIGLLTFFAITHKLEQKVSFTIEFRDGSTMTKTVSASYYHDKHLQFFNNEKRQGKRWKCLFGTSTCTLKAVNLDN